MTTPTKPFRRVRALPGTGALRRLLRRPWIVQLVATAGFVALALWRVDLAGVVEPLRDANYVWAFLALLVYLATRVLDTLRWRIYLAKAGRVPLLDLFGALLIGNFGNNVLPMRAGDLAKIQIVANRYGVSRATLASSVFVVENVMDGITFLALLLVALAVLDIGFVPAALLWFLAFAAGGGFALAMVASRFFPRRMPDIRLLRLIPADLREALAAAWPRFLDGLEAMRNFRLLGRAACYNLASWLSQAVLFWVFGLALELGLSFSTFIVVMVAVNLVDAFPITFQNLGTYEVAVIELLVVAGAAREEAFAYAVVTHVLTNLWVVALGLVALWLMRVRPSEVFTVQRPVGARPALQSPDDRSN